MAGNGHAITSEDDGLAIVRALAQWTLNYQAEASGLDYPFNRPYLDLYERCLTTLRATDAFLRNPPEDKPATDCGCFAVYGGSPCDPD